MSMIALMIIGPAVLGLLALGLCLYLSVRVGSLSKGGKVLAWSGIVVSGLVFFGIGGCYAWMFTGAGRF